MLHPLDQRPAFVGFPPPFAPPRATRAVQEQAQRKDEEDDQPLV